MSNTRYTSKGIQFDDKLDELYTALIKELMVRGIRQAMGKEMLMYVYAREAVKETGAMYKACDDYGVNQTRIYRYGIREKGKKGLFKKVRGSLNE